MEISVDNSFIKKYTRGGERHDNYDKTVNICQHLSFHIDGYEWGQKNPNPYFAILIDESRPSESDLIKEYRRKIYKPKTKTPCFKVLNSLKKIVKSKDWKVDYSKSEVPPSIPEGETLEQYTEHDFPMFQSVENWLYSYGIKQILTDPNGMVVIMPTEFDVKPNEFVKPFTYFIPSKKVFDYVCDEYIVFESSHTSKFMNGKMEVTAPVIYAMDKNTIWRATKVNANNDYNVEIVQQHNIGKLPAYKGGGIYKEISNDTPLFDSFLSAMLPDLDVASRESSDLDASVVQNMFPTMWYMAGDNCKACHGSGAVLKQGKQIVCPDCKGAGAMEKSPYKDMVIKKDFMQGANTPIPPAGFLTKPTDIIKLQDERIRNHILNALSALNMEFLATTPLNQSGTAKEVDRDELNNFVYGVAYHFVENVMKPAYWFINEYRYKVLIPNEKTRADMLPIIPVPEKFDLLNESILVDQLAKVKDADVDPIIIGELQIDFINKHFRNQPETRDKLVATNRLNPFVGSSAEQIGDMLLAGTITKHDGVKSIYIDDFVERACYEHSDFLKLDMKKQNDIIDGYTTEKVGEIQPVMGALVDDMGGMNELDAEGNEIETPVDVEAEAKAKLKGTVGGVQGIIGINQAVGNGEMTEASAELLLIEIYGFDPSIAGRLIDPPKATKENIQTIVPTLTE
jgi:hypothetical protein